MPFILILLLSLSSICKGQVGEWVWLHGDSIPNQPGNYGVQGVTNSTNVPPSLYEPSEWTDLNGNFWLLESGGNDLWKYDPLINQWTWVKGMNAPNSGNYGVQGVPSPANLPPPRVTCSASWTDLNNNLWLFGGQGPGVGGLSDLWKYEISTSEWTWMHGPSIGSQVGIYGTLGVPNPINNPGARWETSAAWTDSSNNLWLFGGYEINQGVFNDLWRYNIATNMWTWMKGSQFNGQLGIYGIKGIESSDNTPGARQAYGRWKDNDGNLWLFGGLNYGILYNDLWRYNPNTNNWAWIAGDSSSNTNSVYGRKCLPSSTNKPGARFENRVSVVDSNGNFWMFGGTNDNSFSQVWNDLWSYKVTANQWIWMSGDSIANPIGNWGTIGLSMPTNKPNGRAGAVGWDDNNGHLYLFGGSTTSINGSYNDLWKYSIDTTCFYTNINELNLNEQLINVYPNPTNGDLIIVIHKNFQKVEFTLINRLGEKVFLSIESNIILGFTKNISINNLSKGIYFLEVNMDGKRVMRKVVKE